MFCTCSGFSYSSAICRNDFMIYSSAHVAPGRFDHSASETQLLYFSHPRNVSQNVSLSGCIHCIPEGRGAYLILLFLSSVHGNTFLRGRLHYIKFSPSSERINTFSSHFPHAERVEVRIVRWVLVLGFFTFQSFDESVSVKGRMQYCPTLKQPHEEKAPCGGCPEEEWS